MAKHEGKCALCGKEGKLTYEHIPPRVSNNSKPVRPVTLETRLRSTPKYPWDMNGMTYVNMQQGMGLYSLCSSCNSMTGANYGNAYNDFAQKAMVLLSAPIGDEYHSVGFDGLYPLRIIKQILSMFCSVNPEVAIDDLREFVLDKEAVGIDTSRYKVCMYFTRTGSKRYNGLGARIEGNGDILLFSEITFAPFGFLLYIDPPENAKLAGFDITSFADHTYDDICSVKMPLDIREVNNWLPHDYRTRAEITAAVDSAEKTLDELRGTQNNE